MIEVDDIHSARKLIRGEADLIILDIRTDAEFNSSHLPGARHFDIMKSNAFDWLNGFEKDRPYLIYCSIGVRSASTVKLMVDLGFEKVFHLTNGIDQYIHVNQKETKILF